MTNPLLEATALPAFDRITPDDVLPAIDTCLTRYRQRVDEVLQQACLLYTSDAADERSSVDLGGRRIIKKKHTHTNTHNTRLTLATRPQLGDHSNTCRQIKYTE